MLLTELTVPLFSVLVLTLFCACYTLYCLIETLIVLIDKIFKGKKEVKK